MVHECQHCGGDVDHCHGTLVIHADGTCECTDEPCEDTHKDRHDLVVECWQVNGGCACATEVTVSFRAVS